MNKQDDGPIHQFCYLASQRSHHYLPSPSLKIFLFLVLYVAIEKSGFRAEANEIAVILLPSTSIVFF
ncbi:hypothetical protein MTR_2g029093 [Medicago truncatula]|uniref:Uncharacterized protein n=1 Tax=Medicago truncatula TaxID=3880 RepID=A0A072V5V5_MEDTR|nr:hypothetical protein MTR_2g029093 [Medicago truncatula]